MRARGLVVLCVLGAAAVAGGWYFGTARQPAEQTNVAAGTLMFPGLTAQLGDAARIEITHQGKTITLVRLGDGAESPWGLEQRGNYPVQVTKLRAMLTALTELRLVEPRTTDPALYERLGLADATDAKGSSDLVKVDDKAGKPIAELLVGHRRVRTQGNVPDQVFVRRPGEAQTWLAEGSLEVDADPQLWLDRDVMNIDHARIAGVVVQRGATTLAFAAKDGKLVLASNVTAPKLEDFKLDDLDRGLEMLTFEDVTPDKDAAASKVGDPIATSVFSTTDGLAVHVTLLKGEKDIWARFSASAGDAGVGDKAVGDKVAGDKAAADKSGTETAGAGNAGVASAKDTAARLNARWSGWTFQLGSWKEATLAPDVDMLKAPPATPAAAAPGAGPDGTAPGAPGAPGGAVPDGAAPGVAAPGAASGGAAPGGAAAGGAAADGTAPAQTPAAPATPRP